MAVLERIHLAIISEVERQGSLTAAASQLNLTQSALSHAIRKLEDQIGVDVWRREGRSLLPTQAGEYLLAVANRLLPQPGAAPEHNTTGTGAARSLGNRAVGLLTTLGDRAARRNNEPGGGAART